MKSNSTELSKPARLVVVGALWLLIATTVGTLAARAQAVFTPLARPPTEKSASNFFSTNGLAAESALLASEPDPERDNPERLRSYVNKFSINTNNWQLLTGTKTEIYRLARNGFMIVATDGDGGPEDFIHSEKLVLIDKQRRIRGYYNGTNSAEVNNLINDIKKLQHEN